MVFAAEARRRMAQRQSQSRLHVGKRGERRILCKASAARSSQCCKVYWVLSNVTDGPDGPAGLCPAISALGQNLALPNLLILDFALGIFGDLCGCLSYLSDARTNRSRHASRARSPTRRSACIIGHTRRPGHGQLRACLVRSVAQLSKKPHLLQGVL